MRLVTAEEQVTIAVSDHGVGIAAADRQRIFERFERVSADKAAGLGLGLWITQNLVHAMRGRVLVTGSLGEGSTFTIELPRHMTPATVGLAGTDASRAADGGRVSTTTPLADNAVAEESSP